MRAAVALGLLWGLLSSQVFAQAVQPSAVNGTQYLSSAPTLSNFQKYPFLSDSHGNLLVNCFTGCSGGGGGSNVTIVAPLGSMLSAASVSVVPASDYVPPLSAGAATATLQTTGNSTLSSILTALGSPFQAGGSIGNTAFGISGTLPAFAAIPTFKIDQTTPGTTNAVSVTNFPATQPVSGTVAVSNFPATQPVSGTVAVTQSTSPWVVGQSTAANLNATVVGTGTFATQSTVAQATAANLNATVVGTGTFAVQAAQSSTWTVQPGNTPNTAPWLVAPKAVALTTAGCAVTASSSTCLAANSVTTHLQIQNTSSATTNNIACNFGGTAILNDKGSFLLTPGQAANWGQATGVVPTGALNCIATSNPAQLYVEYN